MTKKIGQKIVGYTVATEEQTKEAATKVSESNIIQMHEKVSRPDTKSRRLCRIMRCT